MSHLISPLSTSSPCTMTPQTALSLQNSSPRVHCVLNPGFSLIAGFAPSHFTAPLAGFTPKGAPSLCGPELGPRVVTLCVSKTLKTKFQNLICLPPSSPWSSFSALSNYVLKSSGTEHTPPELHGLSSFPPIVAQPTSEPIRTLPLQPPTQGLNHAIGLSAFAPPAPPLFTQVRRTCWENHCDNLWINLPNFRLSFFNF